ncbi:MAG: flavodoxin family protein [Thermodesulfobacteriota bacterium]
MKVVAINGSPRKEGNTSTLLKYVLAELAAEGIDTELVFLAGKKIGGCIACYKCFEKKDKKCSGRKDDLNAVLEKMVEADGILLGSPTYFSNVTPELKALIDRAGLVGTANGGLFARKAGAAVVAVRRAGSVFVFDAINHFFLYSQMIVPGSSYWNVGIGLEPGDVEKDREGIRTMKTLGKNMAWLLKKCGE